MKKLLLFFAFLLCLLEGYSQSIFVDNGVCFFNEEFTLNGTENGKNRYTVGLFEIKWDGSQWIIRSTFGMGTTYATSSYNSAPSPPDDATATAAGMPWVADPTNCAGASFTVTGTGTQDFLPVELTRFTANIKTSDVVSIEWLTANETNNEGFELQKSLDAKTWNSISFINGMGTTNEPQYYAFSDRVSVSSMLYYRLKQMDFDGGFEYSDVVSVDLTKEGELNIFPNPATNEIRVSGTEDEIIQITNINGQILLQQNLSHPIIDISALSKGIYLIKKVNLEGQILTQKLMVQ